MSLLQIRTAWQTRPILTIPNTPSDDFTIRTTPPVDVENESNVAADSSSGYVASRGGRPTTATMPTPARVAKTGMAKWANREPNQSSNIGTSSPAWRWNTPSGHPFAVTRANPSPRRTATAAFSRRSRRRVIPQNHKYPRQASSPTPTAVCTVRSSRALGLRVSGLPTHGAGQRDQLSSADPVTVADWRC